MRNKIIFLPLLTLGLFTVCFFALKPLFVQGFFTMHDDEQIGRLYEMIKILGQGQFPPPDGYLI